MFKGMLKMSIVSNDGSVLSDEALECLGDIFQGNDEYDPRTRRQVSREEELDRELDFDELVEATQRSS
jgi:hypothetical protein